MQQKEGRLTCVKETVHHRGHEIILFYILYYTQYAGYKNLVVFSVGVVTKSSFYTDVNWLSCNRGGGTRGHGRHFEHLYKAFLRYQYQILNTA